jgi:hypothetical protein
MQARDEAPGEHVKELEDLLKTSPKPQANLSTPSDPKPSNTTPAHKSPTLVLNQNTITPEQDISNPIDNQQYELNITENDDKDDEANFMGGFKRKLNGHQFD